MIREKKIFFNDIAETRCFMGRIFNYLDLGTRLAKFGVGIGVYGVDYMLNTFNAGYSNPFTYSGLGQKASVGSTKSLFYYLLTD